jgi:hypothetical protein
MGQHRRQFANFRRAHQTRCGDVISNMARCGAEVCQTEMLYWSVQCPHHTVRRMVLFAPEHRNWHLMVFLGNNDSLIMTIWCIGIGSSESVLRASVYAEREAANVGASCVPIFRDIIGVAQPLSGSCTVLYNVDMPNVCLKHLNDMHTHCLSEFSRPQMPDPRIDHPPSRFHMALQTPHHFVVFHRC